jgi:hypothetical protein
MGNNRGFFSFLLISFFSVLIWSFTDPRNRFIWNLDAAPAIIGFILLLLTSLVSFTASLCIDGFCRYSVNRRPLYLSRSALVQLAATPLI